MKVALFSDIHLSAHELKYRGQLFTEFMSYSDLHMCEDSICCDLLNCFICKEIKFIFKKQMWKNLLSLLLWKDVHLSIYLYTYAISQLSNCMLLQTEFNGIHFCMCMCTFLYSHYFKYQLSFTFFLVLDTNQLSERKI